jgi:predicted transport protein
MDLFFISGDFFEQSLPRDRDYLLKYFNTKIQRQFVKYYLLFRSSKNFTDHTGIRVQPLWLKKLSTKLRLLEEAHAEAKKAFDTETVAKIESGKYRVRRRGRPPK